MKNQLSLRLIGAIILAIVGGACLGYFQDTITTNLLSISFLSVLLIGGMVAWVVCAVCYGAAFRVSWLSRLGIEPTLPRLIFILLWWLSAVVGSVVFFSLSSTISMPLFGVILISAGMGMAYSFYLMVLPLFIIWGIGSALRKKPQGRASAKRQAKRHG